MNIMHHQFTSIEQMHNQMSPQKSNRQTSLLPKQASDFAKVLQEKQEIQENQTRAKYSELRFSKHAKERLADRKIALSAEQIQRLEQGTNKAREKGIQESLVMVDDLAFIVNIRNNTVITAVNDTKDSVFTNIDGAVIS